MVVERVVENCMPAAVEVMREVDECETAVEKSLQVFELLQHDSCRREEGKLLPIRHHGPAQEKAGC